MPSSWSDACTDCKPAAYHCHHAHMENEFQEDILQEAEVGAAKKVFDLDLPELGPYNLAFTRSGRHLLLGGRKGHLALMDWQQRHLVCEVQVHT